MQRTCTPNGEKPAWFRLHEACSHTKLFNPKTKLGFEFQQPSREGGSLMQTERKWRKFSGPNEKDREKHAERKSPSVTNSKRLFSSGTLSFLFLLSSFFFGCCSFRQNVGYKSWTSGYLVTGTRGIEKKRERREGRNGAKSFGFTVKVSPSFRDAARVNRHKTRKKIAEKRGEKKQGRD